MGPLPHTPLYTRTRGIHSLRAPSLLLLLLLLLHALPFLLTLLALSRLCFLLLLLLLLPLLHNIPLLQLPIPLLLLLLLSLTLTPLTLLHVQLQLAERESVKAAQVDVHLTLRRSDSGFCKLRRGGLDLSATCGGNV